MSNNCIKNEIKNNYTNPWDTLVAAQMIRGLKDKSVVTKLLKAEDLSLNHAIRMARSHEQTKEETEFLEGTSIVFKL